jgi:ATP-binding cassette subfamily B protein
MSEKEAAAVKAAPTARPKHYGMGVFRYIKNYWKDTIFTWVFVLFESVSEVLIAFFMQDIIDYIAAGDMTSTYIYCGVVAGLALLAILFGILAGFFASSAAVGFAKNLRRAMFVHIQDYSFSNIDKFSPSSIVTRTTTDVTNIQNSFMMGIRTVVRAPMIIVISLILCFITEWKLAWIFLAVMPFVLFILIKLSDKVHPYFVKVFNTYDDLNGLVEENVDGIRAVKAFNREEQEKGRFGKVSDSILTNFVKAERLLSLNNPIMTGAVYLVMLLLSYFGARLIVESGGSDLTTGALTSMFTYVQMIFTSLMMVSMVYVLITMSANSAERIVEILDEKPDIVNPKENALTEVKDGSISFKDVSFAYSEGKNVLEDINLDIPTGSTVGIIGPTGSGKTTLVSLIARLFDVTEGEILVGGEDVRQYDLKTLRDNVAVVLQKNTLFSGTIRSNLLWGNEHATEEEMRAACDIAQASSFIDSFPKGLDTEIDQGGTNVSGGQKQRLCIARALLKNPKILILDDSTSACDTHTDALIRKALMNTRPDITKLIIAQRVLSIKDCDTIIVLDNGKIVAKGSNEELLKTSEIYRSIYESQQGGGGDFDEAE